VKAFFESFFITVSFQSFDKFTLTQKRGQGNAILKGRILFIFNEKKIAKPGGICVK